MVPYLGFVNLLKSGFPPPKEAPNYMHHTKILACLGSYTDHFGIPGKVRLRHEDLRVTQAKDYDSTSRWDDVKDLANGIERRETFDAVLVASGRHGFPNLPTFKGQEKFKGRIVHTHSLKIPDQFKDKIVAVVGNGNSAVDAAVDACHVTAETAFTVLHFCSDFPPPKEAPNFMHHTKMLAYIRSYADHFGITGKVRLRHEVLRVTQAEDYDSTGRWDVLIKDRNGDVECRETFDAVLVALGHYRFANVPTFKGQEKFEGRIVHTHSLKVPDQFKDRRVAVVGIGNSGVDAAVDACHVAAEIE
ncbi:dimethylaniline monooxygenase [N-oxide-forming] 2-like [Ixodes scapularis]|uniref:dimethylaniline monooxygenase [N-oxide-forming] 2-like n=1 Tax=Ixodes scapularis TaxID=6945 RepID=UPI001A9E0BC3|nr:dimethylaniline monooxygenase [N-oxide-forming] 2-like [Ixodes scapularis]